MQTGVDHLNTFLEVDNLTELEKAIGGKLERKGHREIPGVVPVEGLEVVYYQDDGRKVTRRSPLIFRITDWIVEPSAKGGGFISDPCTIRVPDGRLFRAASYHGDVEGWRKDVEEGIRRLGLQMARIEAERLLISDGSSFSLVDCDVKAE